MCLCVFLHFPTNSAHNKGLSTQTLNNKLWSKKMEQQINFYSFFPSPKYLFYIFRDTISVRFFCLSCSFPLPVFHFIFYSCPLLQCSIDDSVRYQILLTIRFWHSVPIWPHSPLFLLAISFQFFAELFFFESFFYRIGYEFQFWVVCEHIVIFSSLFFSVFALIFSAHRHIERWFNSTASSLSLSDSLIHWPNSRENRMCNALISDRHVIGNRYMVLYTDENWWHNGL